MQGAGREQPFRRDRWPADVGVERVELGIETRQRIGHDPPYRGKRMTLRNPLLKVDDTQSPFINEGLRYLTCGGLRYTRPSRR